MDEIAQSVFFHAVRRVEEKCKGCVNCIKRCPVEAIRVRDGKANIIEARCIDCGECVRICPNQAKIVVADSMADLKKYKYNVAIPAPAIYGQFREGTSPKNVLAAFLTIGFDHVVDVAFAADLVAEKIREAIKSTSEPRPLISSACPAVVRLIQVRFPNLIENIMPVISPMRAAAIMAREELRKKLDLSYQEIGVFFITPCPGKVSAVNDPAGFEDKIISGAIPIAEVYPLIREKLSKSKEELNQLSKKLLTGSGLGVGWARAGGEVHSIGEMNQIAVDGIHSVIEILEEVERGKLNDVDYIEAQACVGGCVGGVLTVENPFITRRRIRMIASDDKPTKENLKYAQAESKLIKRKDWFRHDKPIEARPTLKLDDDMAEAIRKMELMEQILEDLPGLDCGSCGAPNCQALAEDVVRGLATEMDCMFKLREKVRVLASEMMELAEKAPPAMGSSDKKAGKADVAERNSDNTESESEK